MRKLIKRFALMFLIAVIVCSFLLGGCTSASGTAVLKGDSDLKFQNTTGVNNPADGGSDGEASSVEDQTPNTPSAEEMENDIQQGGSEVELPVQAVRRYVRADKEVYQVDTQKIYVTANGSTSGWLGIYKSDDTELNAPVKQITLEDLGGVRWCVPASDLGVGEYKIVLFEEAGVSLQKANCSVTIVENAVYTNKTQYYQNEDIVVMPYGGLGSWVGMFRKNDTPSASNCLGRFDFNGVSGSGLGYIMQESAGTADFVDPGEYKLIIFSEKNNFESATGASTEFTVVGGSAGEAAPPVSVMFNLDSLDGGFASGTVMLSFNKNKFNVSEVVAYWADDTGVLENYEAFAGERVTGTTMYYRSLEKVYIPEEATNIRFYGKNADGQGNAYYRLNLPDGCNYVRGDAISEFAFLSDTHIDADIPVNSENFKKALSDIVTISPENDGVFIVGDVTNDGQAEQWNMVEDLVAEVEGEKSTDLSMNYIIGNHDFYEAFHGKTFQEAMKPYQELMGITDVSTDPNDEAITYYSRTVNGIHHIVMGTCQRDGNWVDARISDTQLAWLESELEKAEAENPDMPIFVYLHQPMTDTTAGTLVGQGWDHVRTWDEGKKEWVNDVQPIRDILSKHPQAFFINGHNHRDLNDTYRITSFASTELRNNVIQTGGTAYLSTTWGPSEGHQGWFVYVYEDGVLFLGREFSTGKWLPGACLLFKK